MTLYILHGVFHLALLLYVRPETFGPYYVHGPWMMNTKISEILDLALNLRHCSSDRILFLIVQFEIVIPVFSGSVNVRT